MSSQGNTTIKTDIQASTAADADDPPQINSGLQTLVYLLHRAQYISLSYVEHAFALCGG